MENQRRKQRNRQRVRAFLEIGTLCLLPTFRGNTTFKQQLALLSLAEKFPRIRDRAKNIYGTRPEI